jgi:hypothetical protein
VTKELTPEGRRFVAAHESGHAVMAALLGLTVETVSIRPSANFCGVACITDWDAVEWLAEVRGRRRGKSLLARTGLLPVPWFAEELRRASVVIMTHLAGPVAEVVLAPPASNGYTDDADERAAVKVAASLTERQQRHLFAVEESDALVSDEEAAAEAERQIAGKEAAGRLVTWLGWETRRIVGSELFRGLALPVADQLVAHDVIGGQVVHQAIDAQMPRRGQGRAAARITNKEDA